MSAVRPRGARADAVLVDTGPLVALFDRRDPLHARARATLEHLRATPLISCEAVVAEASHLLGTSARRLALQTWLGLDHVELRAIDRGERGALATAMERYADLPMDYADAVLVHLASTGGISRIWTYDRRDFAVYRVRGRPLRLVD